MPRSGTGILRKKKISQKKKKKKDKGICLLFLKESKLKLRLLDWPSLFAAVMPRSQLF